MNKVETDFVPHLLPVHAPYIPGAEAPGLLDADSAEIVAADARRGIEDILGTGLGDARPTPGQMCVEPGLSMPERSRAAMFATIWRNAEPAPAAASQPDTEPVYPTSVTLHRRVS